MSDSDATPQIPPRSPDAPIPPLPAGPLNAPVHGPRLPGHPGPHQQPQQVAPQPGFALANPAGFQPTLPVEPTDYPNFWRTPAWRWWRPLVAAAVAAVLAVIAMLVLVIIAMAIDTATGRVDPTAPDFDPNKVTALGFLANNVSLAAIIPVTLLVSWLIFKQRPGFTASVVGTMRWGWLGRCILVILPIWLVYAAVETWLMLRSGGGQDLAVNRDTVLLIIGILLTTPLQAAGEEFGFRGVINRAVASFFRRPVFGLLAGGLVSTLAFTALHGAQDMWLNALYFLFGAVACYVTWRTGGLEGAIAMHAVNNLLAVKFVPFTDISGMFNRESGTAGPGDFAAMAVIVLLGATVIVWQAKRQGIVRQAAPGASMHQALIGAPAPQGMAYLPNPLPPTTAPPMSQPNRHGAPLDNPMPWRDDSADR